MGFTHPQLSKMRLDNAKNQLEKCKDDVEERQREIEKLYKQRT